MGKSALPLIVLLLASGCAQAPAKETVAQNDALPESPDDIAPAIPPALPGLESEGVPREPRQSIEPRTAVSPAPSAMPAWQPQGPVMQPTPTSDKPVLQNLGVDFGPWDRKTNTAGSFKFTQGLFDDKIFLESASYVVGSSGPKLIPELTYHLPEGTKVFSPIDGKLFRAEKIYSGDYTVHIQHADGSQWLVSFEHLENLQVRQGQDIKAGDVIGEASTFGGKDGFAFTELVVWKGGSTERDIVKYCPVVLLDERVRGEYEAKIAQLAEDWEAYMGRDIYDEKSWAAPGCMRESLTEYEALNPPAQN